MDNLILLVIIIICVLFLLKCLNLVYVNTKYKELFNVNSIHPLNNFFDKVYVIALPKRKKHMEDLMKKNNIQYEIVDAITPETLSKDKLLRKKYISKECNLNDGRIYCHMSHIYIMKDIIKNNYKNGFIFEDDIDKNDFNNITDKRIKLALNNLPKDYEIFYISKCWDIKKRNIKINNYIYRPYRPLCRHAYGVSNSAAKKIVKYTLPMKYLPGDKMYSQLILNKILNAYSTYNQLYHQNRKIFGSTLGNYKEGSIQKTYI